MSQHDRGSGDEDANALRIGTPTPPQSPHDSRSAGQVINGPGPAGQAPCRDPGPAAKPALGPSAPIASGAVAASRPLTSPSSALLYAVTMRGEMCLG
jgi:hypothetical protein